ncbi:MAG: nucleotide pyrophosphohydrolase [Candidatus Moranbacteria bacterium]|nr:nucleotide pyrophosphohydrolase [Candidatus Moranbacteria bacterium]
MKDIIEALIKFRNDRDWQKFHTPENLAKSIVIEAAELLENFQWGMDFVNVENVKEELADVMIYSLLLCERFGFNLEMIIQEKIEKNRKKYPDK